MIPRPRRSGIVDVDELFNALNANTREGLRRVIRGFGAGIRARAPRRTSPPCTSPRRCAPTSRLFSQIDASTPALNQFINQTSTALGADRPRSPELTDLISQAKVTAQALGSDNTSLSQALVNLPPALSKGAATFARLRTRTLPALSRLVAATGPTIAPLTSVPRRA